MDVNQSTSSKVCSKKVGLGAAGVAAVATLAAYAIGPDAAKIASDSAGKTGNEKSCILGKPALFKDLSLPPDLTFDKIAVASDSATVASRLLVLDKRPRFEALYSSDRCFIDSIGWELGRQQDSQRVDITWAPFMKESGLAKSDSRSFPVVSSDGATSSSISGPSVEQIQRELKDKYGMAIIGLKSFADNGYMIYFMSTNENLPRLSYMPMFVSSELKDQGALLEAISRAAPRAVEGLLSLSSVKD